jgi:hypothetical protein
MGTAPLLPEDVMDFSKKTLQNQKPLAEYG